MFEMIIAGAVAFWSYIGASCVMKLTDHLCKLWDARAYWYVNHARDFDFEDEEGRVLGGRRMKLPHHGRHGSRHIGRLRIQAAKILNTNFPEWDVRPEDIRPQTGSWRTNWMLDVFRWELFSRLKQKNSHDGSDLPVVAGCWDSLTEFVRLASKQGCHLYKGEIYIGKEEE